MFDWLNAIPFWAVLSMMPVLVVFELFVTASKMTSDQKKGLLSKAWIFFGVLFPFVWGIEASQSTKEIVLLILMAGYFAIVKPWKLRRLEKNS